MITMVAVATAVASCSSDPADTPPPTISPATAAVSPPVVETPPGAILSLPGGGDAALVDAATGALVVLGGGPAGRGTTLTTFPSTGPSRNVRLPGVATAMVADAGTVYLSTRGGYVTVDLGTMAEVTRRDVEGQADTDFTAITRRADGKIVLGSAAGAVFTLSSETTVQAQLQIFARVDALVAQGNTVAVLDRSQTSVTTIDPSGTKQEHALRAGEGATTMVTDPVGRILVADTRGDGLLVFGTDPLMLRQRYPVPGAPYGLAGSSGLAWISETATNSVVGYDLATGIPVEKVRHRTVQQPNSLSFDDRSGTLYVVSGSGAGVQVIADASRPG